MSDGASNNAGDPNEAGSNGAKIAAALVRASVVAAVVGFVSASGSH